MLSKSKNEAAPGSNIIVICSPVSIISRRVAHAFGDGNRQWRCLTGGTAKAKTGNYTHNQRLQAKWRFFTKQRLSAARTRAGALHLCSLGYGVMAECLNDAVDIGL